MVLRRAASVKELCRIKDVTPELAQQIRYVWQNEPLRPEARKRVDELLGTSGVEWLGYTRKGGYEVYYCNAGDTYATTVIFVNSTLRVGCWGDFFDPIHKIRVE